mgnify:CR=1 FL=1
MDTRLNNIFIVEDDEVFAVTIARALKGRGFICCHAQSVEKAKELIKNEVFDLFLRGKTEIFIELFTKRWAQYIE